MSRYVCQSCKGVETLPLNHLAICQLYQPLNIAAFLSGFPAAVVFIKGTLIPSLASSVLNIMLARKYL